MYNKFERQRRNCFEHNDLRKARYGFTLVEVGLAVAVIVIAALGALCYEYLCIDHVKIARTELTAARIGQLLIEDWKSVGGGLYSPEDLDMGFDRPIDADTGQYVTTINGVPFYISMSDNVIEPPDAITGTSLHELDVTVKWKHDFSSGIPTDSDPAVVLSTYVRPDL